MSRNVRKRALWHVGHKTNDLNQPIHIVSIEIPWFSNMRPVKILISLQESAGRYESADITKTCLYTFEPLNSTFM